MTTSTASDEAIQRIDSRISGPKIFHDSDARLSRLHLRGSPRHAADRTVAIVVVGLNRWLKL